MKAARGVENWGLGIAIALIAFYVITERLEHMGLHFSGYVPCKADGFPWTYSLMILTMVMPKFLGRSTAGKVWVALASRMKGTQDDV